MNSFWRKTSFHRFCFAPLSQWILAKIPAKECCFDLCYISWRRENKFFPLHIHFKHWRKVELIQKEKLAKVVQKNYTHTPIIWYTVIVALEKVFFICTKYEHTNVTESLKRCWIVQPTLDKRRTWYRVFNLVLLTTIMQR